MKVVITYNKDLSRVGKVEDLPDDEARNLIREGRARKATDQDTGGEGGAEQAPADAPAEVEQPEQLQAPAEPEQGKVKGPDRAEHPGAAEPDAKPAGPKDPTGVTDEVTAQLDRGEPVDADAEKMDGAEQAEPKPRKRAGSRAQG